MNNLGKGFTKLAVLKEVVDEASETQRIDNFLLKRLKGVPKSHVYKLLSSGQVRVNGKRIAADYRLVLGDIVRIPPVKMAADNASSAAQSASKPYKSVTFDVLFEDEALLVINKPAGVAVHGGSGVSFGVIEQLRVQRPQAKFLELVHRLDRETSGVLMLAKKRAALVNLHQQIRDGKMEKRYLVLVQGQWKNARQSVRLTLNKYHTAEGERRVAVIPSTASPRAAEKEVSPASPPSLRSPRKRERVGERAVENSHNKTQEGISSHTIFTLQKSWQNFSLLEAELKTGRTHQIRVHLAHLGFPIAGDDKYGDFALNKALARAPKPARLERMFLHARLAVITHPVTGETLRLEAPLAKDLQKFADTLD